MRLTASDPTIGDAAFQLFVGIPVDISAEGDRAAFGTGALTPGTPVVPDTAVFDLTSPSSTRSGRSSRPIRRL